MDINEIELAWAAGFFDGEGCTFIAQKELNRAGVSINQNDPEVLERFKAAVGHLGTIYGPYHKPAANDTYRWVITGWQGSQAVIALLWKHLGSLKRTQATTVLSSCKREQQRVPGFCKRGHDKTENITNWGQCRECMRISDRKRNPTRPRRPRTIPTHCREGHALTKDNLSVRGACLICDRIRNKARWERRKEQRNKQRRAARAE